MIDPRSSPPHPDSHPESHPDSSPVLPEPLARFESWWNEALARDAREHVRSMVLSTVDARGRPSSRVVLLRGFDVRGFVFYTNLDSRKGAEALGQQVAALNFYWPHLGEDLGRQVRVEGTVEQVSDAEADAYFAGRPRESQIGAWASAQSAPIASREALLERVEAERRRFGDGRPVTRPPRWSGLRVVPDAIELWQAAPFRLHLRERYERAPGSGPAGAWNRALLGP